MSMTPMQRTLVALGHGEPDRVPLFLLLTEHGARELGLSIEAYFSCAEYVIEGQLRLHRKYRTDCLYAFYYASIEVEAWGGSTLFIEDGPPLCAGPIIRSPAQIDSLQAPAITEAAGLGRVLDTIRGLKAQVGDTVPIIGVAISPFSLPVMQMGFDRYLDLIFDPKNLSYPTPFACSASKRCGFGGPIAARVRLRCAQQRSQTDGPSNCSAAALTQA